MAINQEQIQGKFKQFTGLAKKEWAKLTDADFSKGTLEQVIGRVEELYGITKADAMAKAEQLMSSLEDKKEQAADGLHKAADKLAEYAEKGQKTFTEAAEGIKHQSEDWVNYMDKCVKEKPLTTLAVAVGIGAIIGSMIAK